MTDFGTSLPILNILWQYVVFPAFHIIQNARFAGVTLVSLLMGFFFIRLSYRYVIMPIVGSGDRLMDKADNIRATRQKRREQIEIERQKQERKNKR